jgi:hypothetical protein
MLISTAIALVIITGYAASVWWLLRDQPRNTVLVIVLIAIAALAVRLAGTNDYPAGLNQDESWRLATAMRLRRDGIVFATDGTHLPALLSIAFRAPLADVFGPTRWASRTYSLVLGALSPLAAFAAASALGMDVISALGASALIAVLPWAIFFSRVDCGGEMIFHQFLLIAALARIVWRGGRWFDIAIGAFGLSLLLYDYWAGRSMLALPVVASVLAAGWARGRCLAVAGIAALVYLPQALRVQDAMLRHLEPHLGEGVVGVLAPKLAHALHALVAPVAGDAYLTISAAAMHPWLVLGAALIGVLWPPRRGLFLLGGFAAGMAPWVLSEGPSSHRILMAYPFVALAAASAFGWIAGPRWRVATVTAFAAIVAVLSLRLYFSADFWPDQSRRIFDWEMTDMVEALPRPVAGRLIATQATAFIFAPYAALYPSYEPWTVDNWLPPDGFRSRYLFHPNYWPLEPFYENILGKERVRRFGRAFWLNFEAGQWAWMQRCGWRYTARCGEAAHSVLIPTMFLLDVGYANRGCNGPTTHLWRGHWRGLAAHLQLEFGGELTVNVNNRVVLRQAGPQGLADLDVAPDDDVEISMVSNTTVSAVMWEVTDVARRIPAWESVEPLSPATAVESAAPSR